MPDLPSGTVTFLFTDIERSTQTVGEIGDERYAELQDAHRRLLREAFEANDGVEVGTEGDAFFVAFARAHDAVQAAVEGQRALAAGSKLQVRMGIHTGEALVREDGYVGHDVHKAKRVSDAGHGGQILLSQVTAELVRDEVELVDLGPHRLKDLEEPQRLFQVGDGHFPPLRSLESFTHNLPLQRSTFVGRQREIEAIRGFLDSHRLVTLTGVGGCGKTRLALQVGAELIDSYGSVFFADLGSVSESATVLPTLAAAVGFPLPESPVDAGAGPTDEALLRFLSRRRCLIILDNCEHLLDAAAGIADRVLASCPGVTILATSREGLEVEGERSFTVPSLSLPEDDADVADSEAVSLFKTRGSEVRSDFDLTPGNIGAVVSICRRLDGIPLAIEFAASRVTHMTPEEIDKRLAESFRFLAGGRRRVQRQQTIAATLDWSYDLLDEPERALLRRLSVFSGSFNLEAAEGACVGDDLERDEVLDLLGSLVTKSLLRTESSGDRTRYRLLETVRLYAADKLKDAGESETFHGRHRDWYLAWLERIPWEGVFASNLTTKRLETERANLFAALEWSVQEDRPDLMARMVARMFWLWFVYGEEAQRWTYLPRPEELEIDAEVRSAYLLCAAVAATWDQSGESLALAERAVEAAEGRRSLALATSLSMLNLFRAVLASFLRDDGLAERCRRELDEARAIASELSSLATVMVDWSIGSAELNLLDPYRAAAPLERALAEADAEHSAVAILACHAGLAGIRHVEGSDGEAVAHTRRVLDLLEKDTWTMATSGVVTNAAAALAGAGDTTQAKELLARWTEEIRRSAIPGAIEELMVGHAAVAAIRGDHERASRLLSWVRSRTLDVLHPIRSPLTMPIYTRYVGEVRKALGAEAARHAREEGRAMSEDEAVAYALEGLES